MADLLTNLAAVAGAAGEENLYIEDVFSTYLYTGNGSTQTITNGININGKGGLVWIKSRSAETDHQLFDTERGATKELISNSTAAEAVDADTLTGFNANGFALGADSNVNTSAATYASWTFRKAPKFFDVVTYTGTGANRTVSHNLGSVPGCIMVKRTDTTGDWQVYHRANTANPETDYLVLNDAAATVDSNTRWNDTQPTDAVFSLGTQATVNASGGTYVAYLWAHDAGGFGDDGLQNVVSCGSFIPTTSMNISLGWEPQFVLIKLSLGSTADWFIVDNMRGMPVGQNGLSLSANNSNADDSAPYVTPTANGFTAGSYFDGRSNTYVYIAIRRGPMKTPTSGTEVFDTALYTGNATARTIDFSSTMPYADMGIWKARTGGTNIFNQNWWTVDRLRGMSSTSANSLGLLAGLPDTETSGGPNEFINDTYTLSSGTSLNINLATFVNYMFLRAFGFFDVVCYTGTGANRTVAHNLGVVPELIIVKRRSAINAWGVYAGDNTDYLVLNTNAATADDNTYWNDTSPTSSVFSVGTNNATNASASTYVAYLFASLAGVSKVGSYTGTGTTLQVNCGFSAGARFVLIKRTDSTGDWYVWDSARGIVAGNDPYLLINSSADEVTSTDYIDPLASGFEISSTAPADINASGGSFVFLAVA